MSKHKHPIKKRRAGLPWICPSGEHRPLSMMAVKTGRKKVDVVRMLFEDTLKEIDG